MALKYYMRAYKTTAPVGYVYWTVTDTPDATGTLSGYPTNELTAITINKTEQVVTALPGMQYAALIENPIGTTSYQLLSSDMLTAPFTLSLSGGNNLEVSQALPTPAFTASYSVANLDLVSSVLTNNFNGENLNVLLSNPNSFSSSVNITQGLKNTFGASTTFTLTANNGIVTRTSSTTFNWYQKSFYGVAAAGQTGSVFLNTLTGFITNTRGTSFSVNASGVQKIYFGCRTGYGNANFTVGGFSGGFSTKTTFSVTNAFGFTENYDLYESDNAGLGSTTVQVS